MPIPLYNSKERNLLTLGILIVLGAFIVYSIRGIFGALLGTMVMYTIFRPILLHLVLKWKWKRSVAAIFIILFSFLVPALLAFEK